MDDCRVRRARACPAGAGHSIGGCTISRFFDREEGQGLAEYALILSLIAIIAIAALMFLGDMIGGTLFTVLAAL